MNILNIIAKDELTNIRNQFSGNDIHMFSKCPITGKFNYAYSELNHTKFFFNNGSEDFGKEKITLALPYDPWLEGITFFNGNSYFLSPYNGGYGFFIDGIPLELPNGHNPCKFVFIGKNTIALQTQKLGEDYVFTFDSGTIPDFSSKNISKGKGMSLVPDGAAYDAGRKRFPELITILRSGTTQNFFKDFKFLNNSDTMISKVGSSAKSAICQPFRGFDGKLYFFVRPRKNKNMYILDEQLIIKYHYGSGVTERFTGIGENGEILSGSGKILGIQTVDFKTPMKTDWYKFKMTSLMPDGLDTVMTYLESKNGEVIFNKSPNQELETQSIFYDKKGNLCFAKKRLNDDNNKIPYGLGTGFAINVGAVEIFNSKDHFDKSNGFYIELRSDIKPYVNVNGIVICSVNGILTELGDFKNSKQKIIVSSLMINPVDKTFVINDGEDILFGKNKIKGLHRIKNFLSKSSSEVKLDDDSIVTSDGKKFKKSLLFK